MSEDRKIDPAGPKDPVHQRIHEVATDLINGRVTPPGRDLLRKSLGEADKIKEPPTFPKGAIRLRDLTIL